MSPNDLRNGLAKVRRKLASPSEGRDAIAARVHAPYRRMVRDRNRRRLAKLGPRSAIHLGCGDVRWPGWVHVDIRRVVHPDVVLDLRGGFPAPPGTLRIVYSEHLFEHLDLQDALVVFADLAGALTADGVVRIAMPDLDELVDRYRGEWRDQVWLQESTYDHIDSPAHMLNVAVRAWGHRYVYSFDELDRRLHDAGFGDVVRHAWGESSIAELQGRETREDSKLIVEARLSER